MGIREELAAELKDAMRAGDRPRLNVIRQIESEISTTKSAPGFEGDVTDDTYLGVITSYVKKMTKARKEYEDAGDKGREQAAKLAFEVEYLGRWLPESLGDDETRELVRAAIGELGAEGPGAMGRVIGHVMKSGAAVDGAVVSRIVREELGA